MLRSSPIFAGRLARPQLASAALAAIVLAPLGFLPARAQGSGCQEQLATHLTERKSLVESIQKLSAGKEKKMDAKAACAAFGKLVANGTTTLKWAETNKDWCQVPDHFVAGIKADHDKVSKIRGQACTMAAKQAESEKKAASGQGSGLLGGDGLEGSFKIPQGAL